jgi:hypothetical protein
MNGKKLYFQSLCMLFVSILAMLCGRGYAVDKPSLTPHVKIQPNCFDLKCPHGPRLTCVISFSQEFDISEVKEDRIMLEDGLRAQSVTVLPKVIIARFSRDDVLPLLSDVIMTRLSRLDALPLVKARFEDLPGTVSLSVSGRLKDGSSFMTQGQLKVICPPRVDVAVEPSVTKLGEKVRVMAKCDEILETLKVFLKQPGIETKAVATKMDYDEGSEFPYRYVSDIDTSDLSAGKAMLTISATDLTGEQRMRTTSLEVR